MDWNIAFLTYLFTLVPKIMAFSEALAFFSSIGAAFGAAGWYIFHDDSTEDGKRLTSKSKTLALLAGIVLVPSAIFLTLMPRQADIALILGVGLGYEQTQKLVQSGRVQRLGGKSLDAIEAWLDDVVDNESPSGEGSTDES